MQRSVDIFLLVSPLVNHLLRSSDENGYPPTAPVRFLASAKSGFFYRVKATLALLLPPSISLRANVFSAHLRKEVYAQLVQENTTVQTPTPLPRNELTHKRPHVSIHHPYSNYRSNISTCPKSKENKGVKSTFNALVNENEALEARPRARLRRHRRQAHSRKPAHADCG